VAYSRYYSGIFLERSRKTMLTLRSESADVSAEILTADLPNIYPKLYR
jgi:hypothetical protein